MLNWRKLEEPTEVFKQKTHLGTWVPTGTHLEAERVTPAVEVTPKPRDESSEARIRRDKAQRDLLTRAFPQRKGRNG
jgi:hypothetical protein